MNESVSLTVSCSVLPYHPVFRAFCAQIEVDTWAYFFRNDNRECVKNENKRKVLAVGSAASIAYDYEWVTNCP